MMAKHLTWCLKRTFVLTTRFHTHLQCRLLASTSNSSIVNKAQPAATGVNKYGINIEDQQNYRDLKMFEEDAKKGRYHAVLVLRKLLCVSEANAIKAVDDYPAFKTLTKKNIYENFQLLRENGMFKSTIKDNKFLLIGTLEDLKSKINCMKIFSITINDGAALFQLSTEVLNVASAHTRIDVVYLPTRNKLHYLAEKFNCDISKICHFVAYSPFILTIPAPKLMTVVEYALGAGMAPEHILSDMALFRYPLWRVKEKIEKAKALGIYPLKPWIMRCNNHMWEIARRRFTEREALFDPNMTREELICEIFGCDADIAKCILNRGQKITTMSFEKFHNNMRLFKAEGYSAEEVMLSTLTVQRKTHTLKKLFEMWKESGLPRTRLSLYCWTTKQLQDEIAKRLAEVGRNVNRNADAE